MNAQNDMMVAMGATTLISWEDFLQLPDGPEQIELLEGELISMPPPERKHMEIVDAKRETAVIQTDVLPGVGIALGRIFED